MPKKGSFLPLYPRLKANSFHADNGCIIWTGTKTKEGYGFIVAEGTNKSTHRVAYELAKGVIPDGLFIDHLCRNPSCINPDHLEAVTQKINNLRGMSPWAINARKTHCNKGHPLSGANFAMYKGRKGIRYRQCRKCQMDRYYASKKLKALESANENT